MSNEETFQDIDSELMPTEIESYCMNCGENGMTRLLLTRIPHFKEVIICAFECPHCGFHNNEIQSGQAIAEKGCQYTCKIQNKKDMNRQIVKSEWASVRIPEIDFETNREARRGYLTTVEGVLQTVSDNLSQGQAVRKYEDPANYELIEAFIQKVENLKNLETHFTIVLYDPSGNSYIENLCAPQPDPQIQISHFRRTRDENEFIGLPPDDQDQIGEGELPEVMEFPSSCSNCNKPAVCRMHMLEIPYFKEVIIMAISCDHCGFKSNEVKSGGAVSPKGKKITLVMTGPEDLSRDVLKSESCRVEIPEIHLELTSGTLGSKFTTVEGLLQQVYDEIKNRNPFNFGDSSVETTKFDAFLAKLDKVIKGETLGTLILDDPLGNSHLQNLYAPDPDPNMTTEEYERTWEQNEDYGLNDIKTENYENDAAKEKEKEKEKENEKKDQS